MKENRQSKIEDKERFVKNVQWTSTFRYNKSFMAKLILSEPDVKERYAQLATKLLSFEKIRSNINWSGINFIFGREIVARIVIKGKTLCIYLPIPPDSLSEGKYKAIDASESKKYSKIPSLLKIKSNGATKNAVRLIDSIAVEKKFKKRLETVSPVLAKNFPADSFENLIARGLIRVIKSDKKIYYRELKAEEVNENIANERNEVDAYRDTVKSADSLMSRHALYGDIIEAMFNGDASVKLSKKIMLRSIDEMWVRAVEDALIAIDELIRKPSRFIDETEEILPIEQTKKITSRSIRHLSQHTNFITKVEGDKVTPYKMLNIFRDDSILTYENRFLNTLLNRLCSFVGRRYEIGLKYGMDEKVTSLDFEDKFIHGEMKGKIKLSIELSEKIDGKQDIKNTVYDSGLWKRVERLNNVVISYSHSDFVRQMGANYIRPPVLRTNVILKNKYFRQCLSLWEFIESYDDGGYGLIVNEQLEELSEEHIREIYYGMAMQYLIFRHNSDEDFNSGDALATLITKKFYPKIIDVIKPIKKDDFAFKVNSEKIEKEGEKDILFALDVALKADHYYENGLEFDLEYSDGDTADEYEEDDEDEENEEEDEEITINGIRYNKSLAAKLSLADYKLKCYFAELCNELLKYKKVKKRSSRGFETFHAGRKKLAQITLKGKRVYLYLATDPESADKKYFIRDVSDIKKYADVPSLFRIKSERGLKYAKELLNDLLAQNGIYETRIPDVIVKAEDYPSDTVENLIERGLIRMYTYLTVNRSEENPADTEPPEDETDNPNTDLTETSDNETVSVDVTEDGAESMEENVDEEKAEEQNDVVSEENDTDGINSDNSINIQNNEKNDIENNERISYNEKDNTLVDGNEGKSRKEKQTFFGRLFRKNR